MNHLSATFPHLNYHSFSPIEMNPFVEYPFLNKIWLPELARIASEAYEEEAVEIANDSTYLTGEAILVYLGDEIIGISGYFPLDSEQTHFALRWHGLVAEYQGKGLSKAIIDDVKTHIEKLYPQAKKLEEFMPVIKKYEPIGEYFTKLGFIKDGAPQSVEWSEDKWQSYVLALTPQLKNKNKNKFK